MRWDKSPDRKEVFYKYFHSIVTQLTRFIVNDMAEENIQPSCSSIPAQAFTDFSEDKLVTESLKALPYLMVWYLNSVMKKKTYLGRKLQMNSRRNFVWKIPIAKAMISVFTTKFK